MSDTPKALRDNSDKPEISQIRFFRTALNKLAAVMSAGRVKYPDSTPGVPNWTLGGKPDSEYLDSCDRHISAFVAGEYYDDEMGTHHLAHAAWNILALLENNYPHQDVRIGAGGGGIEVDPDTPTTVETYVVVVEGEGNDFWYCPTSGDIWYMYFADTQRWSNVYRGVPLTQGMIYDYGLNLHQSYYSTTVPEGAPWL